MVVSDTMSRNYSFDRGDKRRFNQFINRRLFALTPLVLVNPLALRISVCYRITDSGHNQVYSHRLALDIGYSLYQKQHPIHDSEYKCKG